MKYIALISVSASVLALSSCASIKDGQMQDVTIRTPGAENARCYLENEDFKYVAFTDETIKIMKSPHNMMVKCQAPGNRDSEIEVPRLINEEVKTNIFNGFIPGATYDYFSRGAFGYPSEIIVSFNGEQVKPYELPKHQANDLNNLNQKQEYEYLGPTEVISQENRYDQTNPLRKKFRNYGSGRATDMPPVTGSYYDPREEDK